MFFLRNPVTDADAHKHERILTPMNTYTHTLSLGAPPKNRVGPANLEIDEVTTGASLSTSTSSTTESIASLNPKINPKKCKHPCQI
jgi:hypothetical protein